MNAASPQPYVDLGELARWLREHDRYRYFPTAPPLHVPGAVGSPANPIAMVWTDGAADAARKGHPASF